MKFSEKVITRQEPGKKTVDVISPMNISENPAGMLLPQSIQDLPPSPPNVWAIKHVHPFHMSYQLLMSLGDQSRARLLPGHFPEMACKAGQNKALRSCYLKMQETECWMSNIVLC